MASLPKTAPLHQRIDKKRLKDLYIIEQLSIEKIASALRCGRITVREALDYNKIPKRPRRKFGGKIVNELRRLAIGEQAEIFYPAKNPISNFHSVAKLNGLRVSVKSLGDGKYRVKRVEDNKGIPLREQVDKGRLKQLYLTEKLPIEKIASSLGCSRPTIEEALKHHRIPRRQPLGSRVNAIRDLALGEETEIICDVMHPVTNLKTIAGRIGIRISVKPLGNGRFSVKRTGSRVQK